MAALGLPPPFCKKLLRSVLAGHTASHLLAGLPVVSPAGRGGFRRADGVATLIPFVMRKKRGAMHFSCCWPRYRAASWWRGCANHRCEIAGDTLWPAFLRFMRTFTLSC